MSEIKRAPCEGAKPLGERRQGKSNELDGFGALDGLGEKVLRGLCELHGQVIQAATLQLGSGISQAARQLKQLLVDSDGHQELQKRKSHARWRGLPDDLCIVERLSGLG
ncbi:hypothetical protein D3C80_1889410 [compost metagenome]